MALLSGSTREGGFAGAGTSRLESPGQRPSVSPGAGNVTAARAPRDIGQGSDRNIGTGFRGPATTWGTEPSVVPGSLLSRQVIQSPLAPYGGAFNVNSDDLVQAAMANAGLVSGGPMNPSIFDLRKMAQQVQASKNLQGVLGAIMGPFTTPRGPQVPAGILGSSLDSALATPSIEEAIQGQGAQSATYSGPKGVTSLNPAARMASVNAQGLNIPQVQATQAEIDAATRMALAESSNILNERGEISIPAVQAVADVIRNRVVSNQFPNTVQGVLSQPRQFEPYTSGVYATEQFGPQNPNYSAVRDVVQAVMSGEAAPVVGGAVNFGNNAIIQGRPTASQQTQQAFAQMAADPNSITFYSSRNPQEVQQTFGNLPGSIPVDFRTPAVAASQPSVAPTSAPTPAVANLSISQPAYAGNLRTVYAPERAVLPESASLLDRFAALTQPENLFPNAQLTRPTPAGEYIYQPEANRGLLSGMMSVPYRVMRGPIYGQPGIPEGYQARIPTTGMPDPNANVIALKDGGGLVWNGTGYEPISRFRGSLDTRPGGDKREERSRRRRKRQSAEGTTETANASTPSQPVNSAGGILPDWYWQWYNTAGRTGGLLG